MTGHILQSGGGERGSLGGLPRCGCREENKRGGKERIQTQIGLKRQLKGRKVGHKAVTARQKVKESAGQTPPSSFLADCGAVPHNHRSELVKEAGKAAVMRSLLESSNTEARRQLCESQRRTKHSKKNLGKKKSTGAAACLSLSGVRER